MQLNINDVFGVSGEEWLNEKLVFFCIWWRRLFLTDVIFDVEKEVVVYSEPAMDGFLAYQQFRESCRMLGGCESIEKE